MVISTKSDMKHEKIEKNIIVKITFDFGLKVMLFCDKLNEAREFVIANQLLRSALSIGANVREAQNAESLRDFIHKMKTSCKEGEETEYFLQLIDKAYSYGEPKQLLNDLNVINKVLNRIISSSKAKTTSRVD